jgi:hypothetical protein
VTRYVIFETKILEVETCTGASMQPLHLAGVSMSFKRPSHRNQEGTFCSNPASSDHRVLDQVRQAIAGVRFGEIRVNIQDYVSVQIERVEKQRLR